MKERHSSSHSFPPIKMRPERDILLTEAISNNFCQPTQPGPRSSCAICMVISTGAGDWKNEKCLWNSGWAPLPTWRTQGLCTGWPHWAEAQGRWRCHPQWIHDWAALQGVGARLPCGTPRPPRHCHTGSEWHPPVRHPAAPVCALKPGMILNASLFIWLFLLLRSSVSKKVKWLLFSKIYLRLISLT